MLIASLVLLLACAVGPFRSALAQHSVLVLSSGDNPIYERVISSFQTSLGREREELEFVPLTLDGDASTGRQRLAELEDKDVALVFALGTRAITLATEHFTAIPVVSSMVMSLADYASRNNVSGVALEFPAATQLQWMRRILPEARRIGVLFDPALNQDWVDSARQAAEAEGLALVPIPVTDAVDLPAALKKLSREADVLWAIPDNTVYSGATLKEVLLSSFRSRIPLVGLSEAWVRAGAFYALDRDYEDLGRQNAMIARKLLSRTAGERIGPETPDKAVYSINLKTARHMKASVDDRLITGAGKVYE